MKRFYFLALILTTYISSQAFTGPPVDSVIDTIKVQPKVKYWKFAAITNLNFNQISFTNWAAGGESAFSGTASFFPSLYYIIVIINCKDVFGNFIEIIFIFLYKSTLNSRFTH